MNLKDVYLEEAEELLRQMEDTLLMLENNPGDSNLIADMFRSMHTLKGTSSMYGSIRVADFIHNLETLYDKVRNNEIAISTEIIDTTFKALDHLKVIVPNPDFDNEEDLNHHKELSQSILRSMEGGGVSERADVKEESNQVKTYHIFFKPDENIFRDGTNPMLLVDELAELGNAKVNAYLDPVAEDDNFESDKCYTSWDIILVTDKDENDIQDVFIFVEDTSTIEVNILFEGDLLANKDFIKALQRGDYTGEPFGLKSIRDIISKLNLKKTQVEKVRETPTKEKSVEKERTSGRKAEDIDKRSFSSIRVPSEKLDELMNQISELVTAQAGLSLYTQNQKSHDPALELISETIEKLSRNLRDIAFGITLIPINNLFGKFQRVIRDTSMKLGKSVAFETEGGETELDKKIIESLSDPLMHLIRNSMDHGIETPEERVRNGKTEQGTIKLKSYYSGAKVYIIIEDDGKGLDQEKIKNKALERGLITKDAVLTDQEIYNLIFTPGFSTAENVTDLSGRGVGMDVVKKNIQDIRGEIHVDSRVGEGTKITLSLPLTLSVIDGLLVRIKDTSFVIPLGVVKKCYQVKRDQLGNEFNKLIILDEEQIPFMDLRKEFNMMEENMPEDTSIIVIQSEDRKIGICVDEIMGEYQAVLKPVGKYYRDQEFVSGATILGDGSIALVLDTYKIISQRFVNKKVTAQ